ncbi:TlpA family protein disulfide reductase [Catenovulum sp. SM1970]|uniref:TlpA disulfide reductase family protein n=1 Tax=Marinifaba aquimaris TaxID=2741323 RepID=UPI0015722A94|nr:TlpA disulfide reductase family protein [Marinifaba aquimaris]NTS78632.1 TlpA family protein disulfide reductase [Marinifaba aquimaris]
MRYIKLYSFIIICSLVLSHQLQAKTSEQFAFKATTLAGEQIDLNDYLGKQAVYLKFWATWCHYCLAEMPHLQHIDDTYGDDIKVIAINVGISDSVANINTLYKKEGYQVATIFDEQGQLTQQFGVIGTPHHILIDKTGQIKYRTYLATDKLDDLLNQQATQLAFSEGASNE